MYVVWRSERLGAASDSSSQEGSALAWPTHHRLPDEVVHEIPSDQSPCHRGCEGRVQHRHRLSGRSRSAAATIRIPDTEQHFAGAELLGKCVEMFRDALPGIRRVAALGNATDPFSKPFLEHVHLVGKAIGIETPEFFVRTTAEI